MSGTASEAGRLRARYPMGSLRFFIDIILLAAFYGSRVDSTFDRNEYQVSPLGGGGVKAACAEG
jgi:hypothetical protein